MLLNNDQSPWMDEELSIMREAVRKFIEKEFSPSAKKWEKQGYIAVSYTHLTLPTTPYV